MLRRVLIAGLLAGLAAAPAHAAPRTLLMPGVTYERQVQFTSHGPVAIHVLEAPRPGGLHQLRPVLSNGAILGRDKVTSMQASLSGGATVAGVNGDPLASPDGRPSGILLQSGVLGHRPAPDRSSIGITADGTLRVERIRMFGTWRGTGQRRPLDLNEPPGPNGVSLFTPTWGPATPAAPGATEVVISPFPAAAPNVDLTGTAIQVTGNGNTAIPAGGAVLVARGTGAQRLLAEAPVGTPLTVRLLLSPDWSGVVDALGGGPVLVRDGKPVFRHFEAFSTQQVARNPRTGIGQLANGRIVLVVVDGRQPGYSVGMTNFELAQTLVRLGAVTGSGLDAGSSSTMAFDGALLNRPSDGGEREVAEGLFVVYTGVHAPPPREAVVSPNGDGVGETQELSYKLVRPSRVSATLVGPDRVARPVESAEKGPGIYRIRWNGTRQEGGPEAEGTWRFTVTAVDDQGRTSSADRLFSLNRTLGALRVSPALVRVGPTGGQLRATFSLTRSARVTATVETPSGAVYAVAARGRELGAGTQTIAWNGRVNGRGVVHSGRYVLRVAAVNAVGRTELAAPFTVRRVAGRAPARG